MTWRPLVTYRWSHRPRLPSRTTKIRLDSCPRYRRHCVPPKCSSRWACFQVPPTANYFDTFCQSFELLSAYICCSTYMRQFVFVLLVVCLQFLPFVWALFVCFPFIFLHSVCQSFCVAFSAHYESYCCTFCIKILIWFSFLFYCAISNWLQL